MAKLEDHKMDLEHARLHLDRLWHEVFWRRENEQKVVLWTFGLVGALLSLSYAAKIQHSLLQRAVLTGFLLLVGSGAAWYLVQNFKKVNVLAKVIVRINERLGVWKREGSGESLYPEKWMKWGKSTHMKDSVTRYYILLVVITVVVGAFGIWIGP